MALHTFVFLAVLLGFPETRWDRTHSNKVIERSQPTAVLESVEITAIEENEKSWSPASLISRSDAKTVDALIVTTNNDTHLGKGGPNRQQWRLFQPAKHPLKSLAYSFYLPWKTSLFPIVQFASFVTSFSCACYLLINLTQSQALAVKPYGFSSQAIGFTNFASLVGGFIGLFTAGPSSDWISAKLTIKNHGVREPEMRLLTMVPYVFIMILGNFVVGFGFQYHWDWRVRRMADIRR